MVFGKVKNLVEYGDSTLAWLMYSAYLFCMASFLILPVICYSIRFLDRKYMPWWLFTLILTIAGWLLINAAFRGYELYGEMIFGALPESLVVDSSRNTMAREADAVLALYFGWLYLPGLALLLLPVYVLAEYIKNRLESIEEE